MKPKITDAVFAGIVAECLSVAQVLGRLGLIPAGGNYKTAQNRISRLALDTSHFTGKAWNVGARYRNFGKQYSLTEILVENSSYSFTHGLRGRLLKDIKTIYASNVAYRNGCKCLFRWSFTMPVA